MLIVPLSGKWNKKNLPIITIILVVLNSMIFFISNSWDQKVFEGAMNYYEESGLLEKEMDAYAGYVEDQGNESPCTLMDGDNSEAYGECFQAMMSDDVFQEALKKETIIGHSDPDYNWWRESRTHYEAELESTISHSWGMIPSEHRPLTLVSYMFLHGSFMHLLGNMIFLWLVGCTLEVALGKGVYTLMYMATGMFSALFFALVYSSSLAPLIGASGAIAGLMGAFSLLFWRRKIRIFYSVGFYFNTVRVYAWLLFPVWVGSEVVQLAWGGVSNVAYMAHIGGLLSGGAAAIAVTKGLKKEMEDVFDEPPEVDKQTLLMEEAMGCLSRLDVDGAKRALEKVLETNPSHPRALEQLYTLSRNTPEEPSYHEVTTRVVSMLLKDKNRGEDLLETYDDYRKRAPAFKLPPYLWLDLAAFLLVQGRESEARQFLMTLVKKMPTTRGLTKALLSYATHCRRKGNEEEWRHALDIIVTSFPDSSEATIIQKTFAAPDMS